MMKLLQPYHWIIQQPFQWIIQQQSWLTIQQPSQCNSTAISVNNSTAISVDNSTAISVDNLTENSEISVDNSTANFVIKDESLLITTLRPDDDEFSTVVATTKGTVKVTLDATLNTNITSDALKTSHVSLPTSSKDPTKETTSVPKKGADPSLLHPSVVPKKEADPSSLYPSVVGKKGADPSSIKPSATGRKGADPTSLIPSVHARKGVDFKTGESLQKSTNPIEVLNKTDEFNTKEENKSNETTQQATSVDLKSSVTISNESDKKISSNPSSAVPSLGTHKYTPVIKPVPVSTDGSSIEELEVPSTVANIHMKPTAATDLLGKNLEIEMVVEEESSSNSGIIIGVILLVTVVMAVIFMGYRHFKEVWMKRHYSRMDFLIDGMYDM
ncbi:unnamed protein product [Meganyctiphanes norvegica]|uniref:Uncharacterized protein n=1 Tax=Meganyctiphanes norvegica TaxID=48144 RepID=A0AAV2R834_MEGNR